MATLRELIDMFVKTDEDLDMELFVKQNDDEDDDTVLGVMPGYDLTVTVKVVNEAEAILLEFDGNTIGTIIHD